MKALEEIVDQMKPAEAMSAVAKIVRRLFAYADESARMEFLYSLLGDGDENAASGLVYR
jgi:hypothetical protein